MRAALERREIAFGVLTGGRHGGQSRCGLGRHLLGPLDGLLGGGHALEPARHGLELRVHRPHHLGHAVRLHDRVLHDLLLMFERLGLLRHLVRQRLERVDPLLDRLGKRLQLGGLIGHLLEGVALLLELAAGAERLLHLPFGATRHVGERIEPRVEGVDVARVPIQLRDAFAQAVQPRGQRGHLVVRVLHLPGERQYLPVALGEEIEDRLQRRALLLGTGDQQVEGSDLLLFALTFGAGEFQQFEHLILSRERTRQPFAGQSGADS